MACPKCGCKVCYEFDADEDGMASFETTMERCAACGHVFDLEDHAYEDDECDHCHGDGRDPMSDYLLPCPSCQGGQI